MNKPQQTRDNVSRLYLALWPDLETKNRLQSIRHSWTWPHGSAVVKPESLHMTVHFLGDVPNAQIPELIDAIAVPIQPFDLMLGRHQLGASGVAVLKPNSIPAELMQLHVRLDEKLRDLGIVLEKRTYRPHVTLARNAANAIAPMAKQVQPVLWYVDGYALVQSQNGYTILHSYPGLKGV